MLNFRGVSSKPDGPQRKHFKKKHNSSLFCWRVVFFPMFFLVLRNLVNRKKKWDAYFCAFFSGCNINLGNCFWGEHFGRLFHQLCQGKVSEMYFFPSKINHWNLRTKNHPFRKIIVSRPPWRLGLGSSRYPLVN